MKFSRAVSAGIGLIAAVGLLAGCAAVPLAKVAMSRIGGGTAPVIATAATDSPSMMMTLVSRKIKFPIQQLAVKSDVTVWTATDGAQVALRDGVMISTRGFGMDLMSADVPSVVDLLDQNPEHARTNTFLDGLDTPVRRAYTCVVTPVAKTAELATAHHILETCKTDVSLIKNEYWIDAGQRIVKSKQWISSGVGYAIFDTTKG